MYRLFNRFSLRFLGLGIAFFLYFRLDLSSTWGYLSNSDLSLFLATIACVNLVVLLQAWRGYILLDYERGKLKFSEYAKLYFVTMAASATLPGRVGVVAQVPLMHRHGVSLRSGIANMLYDKLCDLAGFLAMSALFGLMVVKNMAISPAALMTMSFITLLVLWYMDIFFEIATKYTKHFFSNKYLESDQSSVRLRLNTKIYALFLTLLRLGGAIVVHLFAASSAGLHEPFSYVAAASSFGALSTFLPVSMLGVGLREGLFLLIFAGRGLPEEQIMTFAVIVLLGYLSTVILGTIVAMADRKKELPS